jgi:hypothetical protein
LVFESTGYDATPTLAVIVIGPALEG